MKPIYLDYNATTPVLPEVISEMIPYFGIKFGNPSSGHFYGIETKNAIEKARAQVAGLLNCQTAEVHFTSGGTESNNMAIKGIAFASRNKGDHIIISGIEHPAVIEVCRYLTQYGFRTTVVGVNNDGITDVDEIIKSITDRTILISVMHANNETGTIQPVGEISDIARRYSIVFHTDAAQSAGKIATDIKKMGVDLLSLAGHKIYAPKGIGALYIRKGIVPEKFLHGAGQEMNIRAGTENVPYIVGLGKACEHAMINQNSYIIHVKSLRDKLYDALISRFPELRLNGHYEKRLPNTLNMSFPGIEANHLLSLMDGISASAGAACHSGLIKISPVLRAMNLTMNYAIGAIRFSTGIFNTSDEIERAIQIIIKQYTLLKKNEKTGEERINTDGNRLMFDEPNVHTEEMPLQANNLSDGILLRDVKLTGLSSNMGCGCKIGPKRLQEIISALPGHDDPDILVSSSTSDDSAVYKLTNDIAVAGTIDFITPPVDDPLTFGMIAAANSLSDIYAMGAKPLFALSIVCFPDKSLEIGILGKITEGAAIIAKEAGINITGGHSVYDNEVKFGLSVTGTIDPERIIRNSTAKPGDVLVITKPIGTGIMLSAWKNGLVSYEEIYPVIKSMITLNRTAAGIMKDHFVSACTDVSGFGLLGHLKEMSVNSGTDAEINFQKIPLFPLVLKMVQIIPCTVSAQKIIEYVNDDVIMQDNIPRYAENILCDPQTSGGLLISIQEAKAKKFIYCLKSSGIEAVTIGKFVKKGSGKINIISK